MAKITIAIIMIISTMAPTEAPTDIATGPAMSLALESDCDDGVVASNSKKKCTIYSKI